MSTPALPLVPLTLLDAVNIMLQAIGESPVSSITNSPIYEVNVAITTIGNINRAVQARGWYFNTDYDYPLAPDANGNITVPASAISVKSYYRDKNIVQRQGKLYDKRNQTFTFTDTERFKIVWLYDFEELPQAARDYISIRAARTFAGNNLGALEEYKFTAADEEQAYAALLAEDLEADPQNFYDTDPALLSMVDRRYYYRYR